MFTAWGRQRSGGLHYKSAGAAKTLLLIGARANSPSILSELYFPKVPVPSDHKFSPDWKGAAPYTAIIAPNGKILYFTQAGAMNPLEVRRALLKKLPDDRYLGQQAYWNSTFLKHFS